MLADKAFHLRIARQAGNQFLSAMLANVFDRLIFNRPLEGFPHVRMAEAIREHETIVEALRAKDAAKVRMTIVRNITNGGAAIIEYMRERETFRIAI
jgi:DNA-binding GntR family transcriptional regulator